ncbi:MAG TPA: hypothetical protein VKB80_32280 [Kofleriaceae bacterium]|nr:hypothetical protein [Kofleriaceae bacterium]
MSAVAIVDTTIVCELLAIPGKSQGDATPILRMLEEKVARGEKLFLPLAAVFETGNHVGGLPSGTTRRHCADKLVSMVTDALELRSPFVAMQLPDPDLMRTWLTEFPDWATRGSGLGDLSIQHDWRRLCALHRGRRVYIWSLDQHLSSYDRPAEI